MKRHAIILIWSVACILNCGCALTYEDSSPFTGQYKRHRTAPLFRSSRTPVLSLKALPDSGAYYRYRFREGQFSVNNPKALLSDLYARGFEITTAWYHGDGRCAPIGEEYITGTIYYPAFIVHLAKRDNGLLKFNFAEIQDARRYICPYGETVYTRVLN